jgi:hypothetical protein
MSVKGFLKPERKKIGIAIAVSILYFIFYAVYRYIECIYFIPNCFFIYEYFQTYILSLLLSLTLTPLYYPFACSIVVLWDYRTGKISGLRVLTKLPTKYQF